MRGKEKNNKEEERKRNACQVGEEKRQTEGRRLKMRKYHEKKVGVT